MDTGREFGIILGMEDIVAHVRQVGTGRAHIGDHVERFGNTEMHGVRALAQRVENEQIKPAQLIAGGGRHLRGVRDIREPPEPESEDHRASVGDTDGQNLVTIDGEWTVNAAQGESRLSTEEWQWRIVENIGKPLMERRFDRRVRVHGDDFLLERIEGAHVVQASGVVGMRVGEEHGINVRHPDCKRLQS